MAGNLKKTNHSELRVYANPDAVAHAAAQLFVELCEQSVRDRGRFTVALSGGSTPKRTYELLATPEFSGRVDWKHVHLFWGDERYVPLDHHDSNYRMTREALLRHVPVPPSNIFPAPTDQAPPEAAALAYETEIRRCFSNTRSLPIFDLIYLGLGTNGHTASLFPHSAILKETNRLAVADFVQEVKSWRISMTASLLNHGRVVAFLVAGKDKAQVLHDVLFGAHDPDRLPAQLIAPHGRLLWLIDEPAAVLVSREKSANLQRDTSSRILRDSA